MGQKNRDEGEGWARRGGLLLLAPSPSRAALLAVAVVSWMVHARSRRCRRGVAVAARAIFWRAVLGRRGARANFSI